MLAIPDATPSILSPHRAPRATPVTPAGGDDAPVVLVLPGFHGSGPRHWQSRWEARWPELVRVEQERWDHPRLGDWAATLEREVRAHRRVILVAHSLACALVAHWSRCGAADRVAAALLVAPADVDRPGRSPELASFAPMPLVRLPFPSWVVASANDPHATLDRARRFAEAWGARFLDAGASGHINVESGHGEWPEGAWLLEQLRHGARREALP
jgi:uncharacterized protein